MDCFYCGKGIRAHCKDPESAIRHFKRCKEYNRCLCGKVFGSQDISSHRKDCGEMNKIIECKTCNFKATYFNMSLHLTGNKCSIEIVKCHLCSSEMERCKLDDHVKYFCFSRSVYCHACQGTYIAKNYGDHRKNECGGEPMSCTNLDCKQAILRRDLRAHLNLCPHTLIRFDSVNSICECGDRERIVWVKRQDALKHNCIKSLGDTIKRLLLRIELLEKSAEVAKIETPTVVSSLVSISNAVTPAATVNAVIPTAATLTPVTSTHSIVDQKSLK